MTINLDAQEKELLGLGLEKLFAILNPEYKRVVGSLLDKLNLKGVNFSRDAIRTGEMSTHEIVDLLNERIILTATSARRKLKVVTLNENKEEDIRVIEEPILEFRMEWQIIDRRNPTHPPVKLADITVVRDFKDERSHR